LSRNAFSEYFWHCYQLLEASKETHGNYMPPYFQFLTVMAFHVFLQEQVDVAIFEVGIGGQFDCTNIVRHPVVCGVTSLGIDHTSILGDTIEQIAWHKAGIFKHGVPAVTIPQPEGAMQVLQQRAADIQCPLYIAPPLDSYIPNMASDGSHKVMLGIPGSHQLINASLALQLCHIWLENRTKSAEDRERLTSLTADAAVRDCPAFQITSLMAEGLKACNWPGRTQQISGPGITYYLDGAHTDQSIQVCADWFIKESAAEEARIGGRVARVLLFNSTGDRKPDVLLAGLLRCNFDCALFCPNIQRLSGHRYEDTVDMKVTLESQLRRCADNRNAWLDLSASQKSHDYSHVPNGLTVGHQLMNASCSTGPMPTLTFKSIADSLVWVSKGLDERLLNNGGHKGKVDVTGLPDCLHAATHVLVLCTGSLHLVGDILSLLDPAVCDQ
jgi:folylpolyglutamate synthase